MVINMSTHLIPFSEPFPQRSLDTETHLSAQRFLTAIPYQQA